MKRPLVLIFSIPLLVFSLGSCNEEESTPPQLSIPDSLSVAEGTGTQQKVIVTLTLNASPPEPVTVEWSTLDGTAMAGEDYIARTEVTTVFQQGETERTEEVMLVPDDLYEEEKEFSIVMSGVKNATLERTTCIVTIQNDDDYIPDLVVQSRYLVEEGTGQRPVLEIPVGLSGASPNEVSFQWRTEGLWAKPGEDFLSVGSTPVTIAPGETEYLLEITILDDDIFEMDDYFDILLTDIEGTKTTDTSIRVYIVNDDEYQPELVSDGFITPDTWQGMILTWSDEFEGTALNTDYWGYDLGGGGWGNNEWQTYTSSPQNSFLLDGKLHIVATDLYGNYFSARLLTRGKKEFTYGRIDIRARMPYGKGIWPALWTLGANFGQVGWPRCGEIDIMEYLGHIQSQTHGALHYNKSGGHQYQDGTYTLPGGQSFHDAFHVFSIVWQENTIKWYVDYNLFLQLTDTDAPFEAFRLPQFFIFNVAVGGNWPGYPDETTVFPQTMEVDYIRIFQVE